MSTHARLLDGGFSISPPFMVAMDHPKFMAGKTKKHFQNRPLGRLDSDNRFTPRQNVVTYRSFDIDSSGTRTYRAKSSSDIIEEQHRIIHNSYTNTRNVKSAPPRRKPVQRNIDTPDRILKDLTIQGNRRPGSSPVKHSRPDSAKTVGQFGMKRRPKTAGAKKPIKPQTESFLKIRVDPDVLRTTEAFYELNRLVHDHWDPTKHNLDEGAFVKGKKKEGPQTSADPKAGNQWLVFGGGGGQKEKNTGVLDAFSSMKEEATDHYHVDGRVGSSIAKQLSTGDKIRIGINGNVKSHDLKINDWFKGDMEEPEETKRVTPRQAVPLCWTDQIENEEFKIIQPRGPSQPKKQLNLCETHPVVFDKRPEKHEERRVSNSRRTQKPSSSFKIKQRTKERIGIDGTKSHSKITSVEIEPEENEGDVEIESANLDDILNSHIKTQKREHQQRAISAASMRSRSELEYTVNPDTTPDGAISRSSSRSGVQPQSLVSESKVSNSRPPTAKVVISASDQELGSLLVTNSNTSSTSSMGSEGQTSNGNARKNIASRDKAVERPSTHNDSRSQKGQPVGRPKPAKPNLHKTGAAMGSTFKDSNNAEASYIQISQQIPVNKDIPDPPAKDVIKSVSSANEALQPKSSEMDKQPISDTNPMLAPSGEHSVLETVPPPPSPTETPDHMKVAFNIPTADDVDSDNNSNSDPSELNEKKSEKK